MTSIAYRKKNACSILKLRRIEQNWVAGKARLREAKMFGFSANAGRPDKAEFRIGANF